VHGVIVYTKTRQCNRELSPPNAVIFDVKAARHATLAAQRHSAAACPCRAKY
jgi:hypothetical protein